MPGEKQLKTTKYLTASDRHWACDIEADGLLDEATRIWCATAINLVTKEKVSCTSREEFHEFLDRNPESILIGHNFMAYDLPMLNRHWGAGIPVRRCVDTFLLSQLYNPVLSRPKGLVGTKGPHSLEAWGLRLRYPKGDFEDFSRFSPEMLRYCMRDTKLTGLLFHKLSARMCSVGFSEGGAELEHLAWNIIQNKQRRNGFPFHKKKGLELYTTLRAREEELKNEIYKLWPPTLQVVAEYKSGRKKDGSENAQYRRHREQYPKLEWLPDEKGYKAYDYVAFNLGSPLQRVEKLLSLGWEPTQFTKKTKKGGGGNPKVDEDSLLEFAKTSGRKEVSALAKWIVVNSRANMIRTWLDAYNEETSAIHGRLFLASTLRYRHSSPNSANIPAIRLEKQDDGSERILRGEEGGYSYESRDLFWSGGDDFDLVGIDATGIQNRCLVHHLIETVGEEAVREFKELSLSGDIHRHNIEVLGLANKAAAKKAYYTIMMGGQGARIAADQAQFGTKLTAKEGKELRKKIIDNIPGFNRLISKLEFELKKTGRITLCDGTPIIVPSPHMVIPYLLQGDESRLMKLAMIYVDREVKKEKLNVKKVADVHDEWQFVSAKVHTDRFIESALPCFIRAGEAFKYNLPIEGDAKVGKTWAETH